MLQFILDKVSCVENLEWSWTALRVQCVNGAEQWNKSQ